MKLNLNRILIIGAMTAILATSVGTVSAQEEGRRRGGGDGGNGGQRGNFDPAQFQQRYMERIRQRMAFTNDTEWAAVQPMVQKVVDARRDTMAFGMGGFGRGGGPGAGGPGGFRGGQSSPEVEALQRALESNAPAAQIKAALERYRAVRKEKEAALTKAQEDLRQVLTAKQEGEAVLLGLLN